MDTVKKIKYIDVNLFSGSIDTLRKELGSFYFLSSSEDFVGSKPYFAPPTTMGGDWDKKPHTHHVFNLIKAYTCDTSECIQYVQMRTGGDKRDYDNYTSDSNLMYKNHKFPIRLIGDESKIMTDKHWRTILLGGKYGSSSYSPIYIESTFDDHSFAYEIPYSMREAKELAAHAPNVSSYENFYYHDIGYEYSYYLKPYEEKIKNYPTNMLPHVYTLQAVDANEDVNYFFPQEIREFVDCNVVNPFMNIADPETILFKPRFQDYPPPYETQEMTTPGLGHDIEYTDRSRNLRAYLALIYDVDRMSEQTKNYILQKYSNVFYNESFITDWFDEISHFDPVSPIGSFPFYAKVLLPTTPPTPEFSKTVDLDGIPIGPGIGPPTIGAASGRFPADYEFITSYDPTSTGPASTSTLMRGVYPSATSIINKHKLQNELLLEIKKQFTNPQRKNDLSYIKEQKTLSGSLVDSELLDTISLNNSSLRSADYLQMIGNMYASARADNSAEGIFMGKKTLEKVSSVNEDSSYRYYKITKILDALDDTIQLVNNSIINSVSEGENDNSLAYVLNYLHSNLSPPETVAYKIKKVTGRLQEGVTRITDTQENYFMNCNALRNAAEKMAYYDTQVKYGQDYSYTIYAYVVLSGYQYKYSDLRIGRNIGTITAALPGTTDFTYDTILEDHCIEFYNPYTSVTVPQLLNKETNLLGLQYEPREDDDVYDLFDHHVNTGMTLKQCDPSTFSPVWNRSYSDFTFYLDEIDNPSAMAWAALDSDDTVQNYLDLYLSEYGSDEHYKQKKSLREKWCLYYKVLPSADGTRSVILAEPGANRYATNAQIKSKNKYVADFNFHMVPSLKIVEIPIAHRAFRISDNLPVAADVTPYQVKDDSQTIGFYVNVESFRFPYNPTDTTSKSVLGKYPTPLNSAESRDRRIYLDSKNMLDDELIKENSVSKVATLEVYRLDKKPNSITDFAQKLVHVKNLSYKQNGRHKLTNCFYEERIQTNKKYYYLFRFRNEHDQPGYISPIQCVEMIDDGGYKYTKFDVIFESELEEDKPSQESKTFKKLLEIVPHPGQLSINDEHTDYSAPAHSQISKLIEHVGSSEELIWGKTFKFRITSKKTGKKLDINVKYNLRNT